MINVCLLGAGRMAWDHAVNVSSISNCRLSSVVDPHTERRNHFASSFQASAYATVNEAFSKENIDAVCIVTPTDTHKTLVESALQLGVPIFCEKPIDLSTEKVRECVRAVEASHVPFLLGFNRRFDPSIQSLRSRLHAGEIEESEQIFITSRDHPMPPIEYLRTSGGMFHDMTIHDFDMVNWLLGEDDAISSVYATGSVLINPELEEFQDVDSSMIVMRSRKNKLIHINNSRHAVFGYDQRIEVLGRKGLLRTENLHPSTVIKNGPLSTEMENPHPSFPSRYKDAYLLLMKHFIEDVVCQKKTPLISARDGLRAAILADSAQQSMQTQQPVFID